MTGEDTSLQLILSPHRDGDGVECGQTGRRRLIRARLFALPCLSFRSKAKKNIIKRKNIRGLFLPRLSPAPRLRADGKASTMTVREIHGQGAPMVNGSSRRIESENNLQLVSMYRIANRTNGHGWLFCTHANVQLEHCPLSRLSYQGHCHQLLQHATCIMVRVTLSFSPFSSQSRALGCCQLLSSCALCLQFRSSS